MSKLIDTFLFSEQFESNCLEVKLNCGSEYIDEWIAIQGDYTFRGEYKGSCLEELLKEERFAKFRNRIHVITIKENLFERICTGHNEKNYFLVEYASRKACWDYIRSKYDDSTRVLMSDVDEVLDLSDADRRSEFFTISAANEAWQTRQLKYWWNYNNLSTYPKFLPIHTVGSLASGRTGFEKRNDHCKQVPSKNLLAVEYSYSFSPLENYRKCSTFSHDRYNLECIEQALFFNTWHKTRERGEILGDQPWDWFETIELTPENTPNFVLENFDRLDTKTIDIDYAENRKKHFNLQYPHPAEQYNLLGSNKIARQCHYYRRIK